MEKRFYLDSCIWRDLLERRSDNIRPLDEFAFQFLKNCRKHNCGVIVSDLVKSELFRDFSKEKISDLFGAYLDLIVFVEPNGAQARESYLLFKTMPPISRADILHAIIARDNNCVLVTRDKHFYELGHIVESFVPEEVSFS